MASNKDPASQKGKRGPLGWYRQNMQGFLTLLTALVNLATEILSKSR